MLKQICATSGPGRIFWFINITEFRSPRTLLEFKVIGHSSLRTMFTQKSVWNGLNSLQNKCAITIIYRHFFK